MTKRVDRSVTGCEVPLDEIRPRNFTQVGGELVQRMGYSPRDAMLFLRIDWHSRYSRDEGWYRASYAALAAEVGFTVDMVRGALASLLKQGYLEASERNGRNSTDRTLSYRPFRASGLESTGRARGRAASWS